MAETIQLKDAWGNDVSPFVDGAWWQLFDRYNVPVDGSTDASDALQNLINNCGSILSFRPGTYILSKSLQIDTSVVKVINGNGAILKVSGDFPAIIMYGSGSSSFTASPSTMTVQQKEVEASTIVKDLKIMCNAVSEIGTGIRIAQCWTPIVQNCYFRFLRIGIEIYGRNRNIIIAENNIYQCGDYGILFAQDSNTHQVNIIGNHISYCQTCIAFNLTQQTANVQIVGNDIEIDNWPGTQSNTTKRCLVIDYQNTSGALFSEMEITGNTIQGHDLSDGLIDISGNSSASIENVSIGENQISNSKGYAIKLAYVHNFTLAGNTYRHISKKIVELTGIIDGFVMSSEVAENGTGYVNSSSTAVLRAITLNALTGRGMSGGMTLSCDTIDGLSISGCNIASSGLTVSASTKDYISVVGNCLRGTYNVATATHRQVENNM